MRADRARLAPAAALIAHGRHALVVLLALCAFLAQDAFAQIAYRAASNASATSGTTLAVNVPTGTVANDVMIASVIFRPCSNGNGNNCTTTLTPPSGWTQVDTVDQKTGGGTGGYGLRLYVYRRVATGSEPASHTWTFGGSPAMNGAVGSILTFAGVDITNPIIANGTATNGTSQNVGAPSVNAGGIANAMLVTTHASLSSGTWTRPTGMTERVDRASLTTPNDLGLSLNVNTLALGNSTGNTGAKTATLTNPPVADAGAGESLILRPANVANFLVEAAGGGAIGTQLAGDPFDIQITARDANNNVVTSFTGTVTITSTGTLSQGSGTTLNFVNGVLVSHTVAISNTGTFTITATSASITGTSAPFNVVALSSYLLADYRMEEGAWSGAATEVADSSGNGYNARGVTATTANTTPAIAGSPGTCRYGVFNRNDAYVELPTTFPNLSGSFAIVAWIRPTNDVGSGQRILIDDENNTGGFGFSLGDGGDGQLRFFNRAVSPIWLDSGAVITTNAWFFVAAVHDATAKTRTLYVYNASGTLLGSWTDTYTGTWGTDTGRASIGGETAASGETGPPFHFGGFIDELKVYNLALTQAQVATLMTQTHPCPVTTTPPGRFNAFETSTASGAITGVIKTKVAGTGFSLAVVALNTAATSVLTSFTGSVTVELLNASDNSGALSSTSQCRSSWTSVIATVSPNPSFTAGNSGRINVTFPAVANAYRDVRVRVTYTSGGTTVIGCSTDNFAIRPASFASVQATDGTDTTPGVTRSLNNTSTTTGVVHRAGRAFTLVGSAVSSTNATTTNYSGTPVLAVTACSVPAGCTAGTMASSLTGSGGAVSGTATYSEAGVITATLSDATFAAVDAADSSAAEMTITGTAITIGRFVPDAYRLTTSTTPTLAPPLCGSGPSSQSFVFVGQGFAFGTNPGVLATPINASGTVLANARPRFGTSAATATIAASGAPVSFTGSVTASTVTTSATATIAFTGSSFSFTRGASPVSSFTPTIAMTVDVSDTTETATTGNTAIGDEATLTITPVAFSPAASPFYYGRIQLSPAFGDYRRDLAVPLEVQAWNGLGWMPLTAAAACVSAGATTFAYSQPTGGLSTAGAFNCATRVASTVTTSNGRASIVIANPPYTASATPSAMTLTLNLLSSASGTSCSALNTTTTATTTGLTWLSWPDGSNPTARVTWGRARGDAMYLRERFD